MTKTLTYAALAALLCFASSCKKDDLETYRLQQACAPTAKVVKTISNAGGFVSFDTNLQQYKISVHQPGTTDVVDVGILCDALPAALQAEGTKVLVSGTFKEYLLGQPGLGGYTNYYLEIESIRLQ
jgi:hypothetical protein